MNQLLSSRILLICRILLGLIFLVSAIGKFIDNEDAKFLVELLASEIYWIIDYSSLIVNSLTIAELILAVLLLWGKWLPKVFLASCFFLLGFIAVLSYFQLQGYEVASCGCFGAFGGGGGLEATLIKDVVLLAVAILGLIMSYKAATPSPGPSESTSS